MLRGGVLQVWGVYGQFLVGPVCGDQKKGKGVMRMGTIAEDIKQKEELKKILPQFMEYLWYNESVLLQIDGWSISGIIKEDGSFEISIRNKEE